MTTNQQQQISFHEYQMPCMLSQNYHEEALWDLEEQRQAGLDDDLFAIINYNTLHGVLSPGFICGLITLSHQRERYPWLLNRRHHTSQENARADGTVASAIGPRAVVEEDGRKKTR
ncbi:hypothetical protein Tco_0724419 [Tanacetum coccineum]